MEHQDVRTPHARGSVRHHSLAVSIGILCTFAKTLLLLLHWALVVQGRRCLQPLRDVQGWFRF